MKKMKLEDFVLRVTYLSENGETVVSDGDSVVSVEKIIEGERLVVTLHTAKKVRLVSARMVQSRAFEEGELFFGGGYQSWTLTREYAPGDRQTGLKNVANLPVVRTFAAASGDYDFASYGRGLYHSHGYTYIRRGGETELFGSLDESFAFTIFYLDAKEQIFAVVKDVEGADVEGDVQLFDIVRFEGDYDAVFDSYFGLYPLRAPERELKRLAGYTSWYNYYQNVTEKIVLRDLEGLYKTAGSAANIFQIDDGYESKVGDWLAVDPVKFPNGMKPMADAIHGKGYLAGIWVAPFAAEFKAAVVKEHPEWLLKGENGKPVIGGFAWNGFYVLDHEKPEVRAYVKKVFDTAIDEWGFDMFKLDFLYAACMIPRGGKSRGRLMHEAMAFLRECVRDKLLLGCGVPMTSSFGFVDACRTGCDAELSFRDRYYVKCTNSEIISTRNSIIDTVFRRHLNGRVFLSDPDVFFLRDGGMKRTDYTQSQKEILARVNKMCGSVLFVSDDPGEYDAKQRAILLDAYLPLDGKILSADMKKDAIRMVFEEKGVEKAFEFDLSTGDYTVRALK